MRNKESGSAYPEKRLSEIQLLGNECLELIGKRWDDILEDVIAISLIILDREYMEKRR